MSDFNVAIVGTGGIYRLAHGPGWGKIRRARVVATCDLVEVRAERASRESGAEFHTTRLEALLERDGIDVVDICTPSHTHAELAIQALRAGKHVICEKPMALNGADAARMMEVARETNRGLYIGHTRRFDRRWTLMKEQIAAGRIGEPVAVRRSERSWGGFPADDEWHWDVSLSGGALMDLGVHIADLFSWFLDAEPQEVYARALTVRPEARASQCFDFGIIHVNYPNGKQGVMEVSWTHPKEFAPFYSFTEVVGTGGKLTLSDKDSSPLTMVAGGIGVPRYSTLLSSFPETFVDELEHFLDCLEGKVEPRVTQAQAAAAVRVVEAAFQSIHSGQPVSLS